MSDAALTPQYLADVFYRAFAPEGYWIETGCVALIIYEHLLTIQNEHKVIWGRKLTIPTALFLINRYTLLFFSISVSLWGFVSWRSNTSCVATVVMQDVCGMIIQVCYTVFSALRIHAINNHRWPWTVVVACLGFVAIPQGVVGIVVSRRVVTVPPPLTGCATLLSEYDGLDAEAWARMAVASEVCTILMDVLVLGITWYRTASTLMLARSVQMKTSMACLMQRDGTIFFILTLGLHVIVIVVDETRHIPLVLVTCTIMSIIMSRFILNLRMHQWSGTDSSLQSMHLTQWDGSVRFAHSVLDNIGAPLDLLSAANDDESEDVDANQHGHERGETDGIQERLESLHLPNPPV